MLNWHGRYRPTELRPASVSSTCYVFKAVDEHIIDKETSLPLKVALKLVRKKTPFLREMKARDRGFSDEFVVNVLPTTVEEGLPSEVRKMLELNSPSSSMKGVLESPAGEEERGEDNGYINKYAAFEHLPEDVEVTRTLIQHPHTTHTNTHALSRLHSYQRTEKCRCDDSPPHPTHRPYQYHIYTHYQPPPNDSCICFTSLWFTPLWFTLSQIITRM